MRAQASLYFWHMKHKTTCLLLLLMTGSFPLLAQNTTESVLVFGSTCDATQENHKLPYVHIVNQTAGKGYLSDSSGRFKVYAQTSDTLLFKHLGYQDYLYSPPDSLEGGYCQLQIPLIPTSYTLEVVEVVRLNWRNQFIQDILAMDEDPEAEKHTLHIPGVFEGDYRKITPHVNPAGPVTGGGLTALYNTFSKKAKSQLKLAELLEDEPKVEAAEAKYNRDKLYTFTHYHPDKLDAFILYLGLSTNYLSQTSEYQIYYRIQQRMPAFENRYFNDSLAALFVADTTEH